MVGISDFPYFEVRALATYFLVVDNFQFRPDRVGIELGMYIMKFIYLIFFNIFFGHFFVMCNEPTTNLNNVSFYVQSM